MHNHFELIVWPLSLSQVIHPSPYLLLVIQDVAIVLAEGVALLWASDISVSRAPDGGIPRWVGVCVVLLLLLLNPWIYQTALSDFHPETIATLFTVLAARDLYNQRMRRASIWMILLLMCGDVGGLYAIGLGIGLVLARPTAWKVATVWISIGIAWVGFISYAGFNAGSHLSGYQYLAGKTTAAAAASITLSDIVEQTLLHPERLWHLVVQRWSTILKNIVPTGIVGIFSRWVIGLFLIVVLTSIGQEYNGFIQPGFQNFVLYVMLPVGTLLVLDTAIRKLSAMRSETGARHPTAGFSTASARMWLGAIAAVALCAFCMVFALGRMAGVFDGVPDTQEGTRATLTGVLQQTPSRAEVVGTSGIIGRFAARPSTYVLSQPVPGSSVPIRQRQVTFVFVPALAYGESASAISSEELFVKDKLHAKTLATQQGVWAFLWTVPPNVTSLTWWPKPAVVTSSLG